MPFLGMEYKKKTYVGFIFLTIPRLGKRQSCIFEIISVKAIPMFSGDHLMPKTPGSEVITLLYQGSLDHVKVGPTPVLELHNL